MIVTCNSSIHSLSLQVLAAIEEVQRAAGLAGVAGAPAKQDRKALEEEARILQEASAKGGQ